MTDHKKALEFYIANQEKLVEEYDGKVLVLVEDEIKHVAETYKDAYEYGVATFGLGNFSIQEVSSGPSSYSVHVATPGVSFS